MIENIDPESFPDPTKVQDGEFAKSQATRTTILEAAVTCLAERGYHATSTTAVVKEAGLSRTAMLYHFPTRIDLIKATIQYVFRRRIESQQEEMHKLTQEDDAFHGQSVKIAWDITAKKEFAAFCELATAARTDEELTNLYRPLFVEYDKVRRQMSSTVARAYKVMHPGFDLRCDVTRFLLEGIAQQDGLTFNSATRMKHIRAFLERIWDDECDELIADVVQRAGD